MRSDDRRQRTHRLVGRETRAAFKRHVTHGREGNDSRRRQVAEYRPAAVGDQRFRMSQPSLQLRHEKFQAGALAEQIFAYAHTEQSERVKARSFTTEKHRNMRRRLPRWRRIGSATESFHPRGKRDC
ncbi:hypothetical protein [Tahibacter sp.]|uniref:hypothetical protein n=1 Tax=Tahibacter sp. TaxID=2056211 RepID=UPI0028C39ABA|nr:hypothetical protein [Tahibacter sp.]